MSMLIFICCLIYIVKSWNMSVINTILKSFTFKHFKIEWCKNYCSGERYVARGPLVNVYSDYWICTMILFLIFIDGYKKQIEDFFKIMNGIKDHFIKHIFIVFPNITFDELRKESKSIEGKLSISLSLSIDCHYYFFQYICILQYMELNRNSFNGL